MTKKWVRRTLLESLGKSYAASQQLPSVIQDSQVLSNDQWKVYTHLGNSCCFWGNTLCYCIRSVYRDNNRDQRRIYQIRSSDLKMCICVNDETRVVISYRLRNSHLQEDSTCQGYIDRNLRDMIGVQTSAFLVPREDQPDRPWERPGYEHWESSRHEDQVMQNQSQCRRRGQRQQGERSKYGET